MTGQRCYTHLLSKFMVVVTLFVAVMSPSPADSATTGASLWPVTASPTLKADPDNSAIEVGVKFRSDSNGLVTGIRFYKASTNTGTHTGSLWSSSGTRLATATFSGETASGWQQVDFATPVAVTANTVYVASYHTNVGHYSCDENYFRSQGVDSPPLHALAAGVSGANGVYAYGSASNFPNQDWNSSNYWVDVVFTSTGAADNIAPTVTAFTMPVNAASLTVGITSLTATDNVAVTGYLLTESSAVPAATASGWTSGVPANYTFASAGNKTVYAWAKDAAGNVSASRSAAVTVTLSDTTPPTVTAFTMPATATALTVGVTSFTASDNVAVTGYLLTETAGTPAATASGWSSTAPGTYTFSSAGSKTVYAWSKDAAGNVSASLSDTISITLASTKPVLLITSTANPFSSYYAEILRTEGLNLFDEKNITQLTATLLTSYDVVLLGDITLTTAQVTTLTNWVNGGGHLIAMHPDKKLAGLLGLSDLGSTLEDAYLLVNTASGAGVGIVSQTMQYHGPADLYGLNGATSLATLYANATTSIFNPAVTIKSVGSAGGMAAAFVYDLARSIVYTRQGNPAWAGQDRDAISPIRSNDLFYGNASFDPEPDWVDPNKISIPQADEQQRLLANLLIQSNQDKKPLPRFWYFPRNLPAVVVMTGDDHGWGTAGTAGRFDAFKADSAAGCSVDNWECIRSTSYVWPSSAVILSNAQAVDYNSAGFEIALHVNTGDGSASYTTGCANYTPSSFETTMISQLAAFRSKFPGLPAPLTNRNHCVTWSDFTTVPTVEFNHGIRLDTTYYFYPPAFVAGRTGFFTGSGLPMRFVNASGSLIDVYQAATQMTDESGQSYPVTIDTLLDGAIGSNGFYGAFTANMHNDVPYSSGADAIVASATTRGIPVITARQLLTWLDSRNGSGFDALTWDGTNLGFSVSANSAARGLTAMVPIASGQNITRVALNGSSIAFDTVTVKGIRYGRFTAASGVYQVSYAVNTTPPTVAISAPAGGSTVTGAVTVVAAASDDTGVARVEFYLDGVLQATDTASPYNWTWYSNQTANGSHSLVATAYDTSGNSSTSSSVTIVVANPVTGVRLVQKGTATTVSGQALATTLPAAVTAGNLLVVSVSGWPNLPATNAVTDSLGNSFTSAGSVLLSQGAFSAIYYAKNVKAGADTITVTTVKAGGQISMTVAEFSGLDTVAPLDKTAGATGTGTTPSSGTITPSQAGTLFVGSGTHNGTTVTSAGSGFTLIAVATEDADSHQPLAMEYQVLSGSQTSAATFGLSAGYSWAQNGASFKPAAQPGADTTPPSVAVSTPVNNSTVSATVAVNATATDNVGVSRVDFLIDGLQQSSVATAPYGWSWNTAQFANGTHTLTAVAYDGAGNSASAAVTVQVSNVADTTKPTVTAFTLPATATTMTVAINSLTATDNVAVTGFMVTEAATAPAAGDSAWSTAAPASFTCGTAGSKTLYAWAKDAAGNVSLPRSAAVTITLPQSGGPEPAGWYAGDMHAHRSCGGEPEAISSLFSRMSSNNLSFLTLQADMGNGELKDPVADLPRVNGQDDPVSSASRIVHWDAEWHWDAIYTQYPHQALGGHVLALGLDSAQQLWQEYTSPIFDWAHQQNGIAGFAHMQYLDNSIPQTLTCCTPIEYPVESVLGGSDFISEDVAGSEAAIQAYYRLLNCGLRPGLAAGTDFPCNGGQELGTLLTYVQVAGGEMTYRNWIEGIAKGRTVISRNGHNEFLDMKVNGSATPGDEIKLTGSGNVTVTIQWTAGQALAGTIELVQNGVVVASKQAAVTQESPASLSATVNFTKSGWLAARRMDANGHQVHTAAVYVIVNSAPIRASKADAEFYVQWMDNLLEKTSPGGAWSSFFPTSRTAAQARYQSARAAFQQIAAEAGGTPATQSIFTTQTPDLYENDAVYEFGTRFWADVSGQITQVRLYTNATEGGIHTVRIWRVADAALVAGPYSWSITSGAEGWKTFTLPAVLPIAANTDYIVAVSTSSDKYYAEHLHGFDSPIVNGNLHTYAGSGVYATTQGAMPTAIWENTNYFRDVVFVP